MLFSHTALFCEKMGETVYNSLCSDLEGGKTDLYPFARVGYFCPGFDSRQREREDLGWWNLGEYLLFPGRHLFNFPFFLLRSFRSA